MAHCDAGWQNKTAKEVTFPAVFCGFDQLAWLIGRVTRTGGYMWSIMTSPKPEHDTWVAPSMRRAKS